jgi:hypothetical protein
MSGEMMDAHVLLSPEIAQYLGSNDVDLIDLLRGEGVAVERKYGEAPSKRDGGGKDVGLILFGSAAVIMSLSPIISKVISALTHKAVVVREKELRPVMTASGQPVVDRDGNPVLQWVTVTKVVESRPAPAENTTITIKGPFGIEIGYAGHQGE